MAHQQSHLRAFVDEDGAAILDINLGKISTLNPTGALVWQALERGEDAETIARNLAVQTGEPVGTVRRDVWAFIQEISQHDLLPR